MALNISYWCEKVWLSHKWAEGVRIDVSADGFITSVIECAEIGGSERVSGVVLPGMPNLHSHAFQRAAAGFAEQRTSEPELQDSFWTWRKVMHAFVTRLTPEDNEAIAAQLYVEMLKAGYTAVGEFHYLHRDKEGQSYDDPCEMSNGILSAAERSGIGLTMLPVLYSIGGYGGVPVNEGQRRYILDVNEFLDLVGRLCAEYANHPQIGIGIAPHSVRQVPEGPLNEVLNGFQRISADGCIHIHASEQVRDVDEHLKYTGSRPVEWLLNNADVDSRWCVVHATHVDNEEIKALANSGAVVGLCPSTEGNLGDGIFPLSEYLKAGGAWGIGSDSHVSISPWEELRWLEYVQRLVGRVRNVGAPDMGGSTGMRLFADAISGGTRALGRPIGAISVGKRADLIVLDPDHPQLFGHKGSTLIDSLIFSGNNNPVCHVMCGGSWVVRDKVHSDEAKIAADFRSTISRLMSEPL